MPRFHFSSLVYPMDALAYAEFKGDLLFDDLLYL